MSDLNFEGLSDKQLRLFAVRCARRVQHLMTDPRSIAVLDVVERYACGEATDKELAEAAETARDAVRDAAWDVARDADWAAAWAARAAAMASAWAAPWAARDAAMTSARASAWVARDAAMASARASAWVATDAAEAAEAARDAELAEQQKILDEIRKEQPK